LAGRRHDARGQGGSKVGRQAARPPVPSNAGDGERAVDEPLVVAEDTLRGFDGSPADMGEARAHLERVVEAGRRPVVDVAPAYGENKAVLRRQPRLGDAN